MRDLIGHLVACQLARVVLARTLYREIEATLRMFLPPAYIDRELKHHSSSLLVRATCAAEGELVDFEGIGRTPIYTYRKDRLIDLLQVTPDEERLMSRLISNDEKRRRETERRRTTDIMARLEWLATNFASRERPWQDDGISRATWYRRRKQEQA